MRFAIAPVYITIIEAAYINNALLEDGDLMRDSEERQRHFVVRDKKDESYDSPAVRRRSTLKEPIEDMDETPEPPRQQRRRKTLREREMEEEEEARSFRAKTKRRRIAEEEDFDEDDYQGARTPKIVKIFAWVALMIILFTCGYVATNYFFSWSDKKGGERIGNVYGSGSEIAAEAPQPDGAGQPSSVKYQLYIPDGGSFQTREVGITSGGAREDDIQKVVAMYIDSLKETKALAPAVSVTGIFQSGEWLYIDLTPEFQSSLKKLGKEKTTQVLNGLLKTVEENFHPINKIKFYVLSKEITDKNPVDLTQPWGGGR